MRYSELFPKTKKSAPKDAVSFNHKLLVRGGYIDQLMAGSWTLLPLGWRVVNKINDIIRDELNKTGAMEISMPLMHPKEIWNETGRWDTAREVMYQLKDTREREFALSFTHEEIVMDLIRKHVTSYRDLPLAIYQFSTKFRNEPRATGGILRGREFLMKDLYSMHESEKDLMKYYHNMINVYQGIFKRLGLKTLIVEASGGVFTSNRTHEFQVLSETGEDTIYVCSQCDWAQNKEVFTGQIGDTCPVCGKGKVEEKRAIEVGNIFPLGIEKYAQKMGVYFTDKDGTKQPVWFGSYGIGPTRTMGTIVEVSHDDKGIMWPESISPFQVHLVDLNGQGEEMYKSLVRSGIEVLWDETERGAGEKLADADLIGIPVRLVVSEKTGGKVEWKKRSDERSELLELDEVIARLKG